MVTDLLDGNVLIALGDDGHVHRELVTAWFDASRRPFATTPTTQGTLLRHLIRSGMGSHDAMTILQGWIGHPRHVFWADDAPYDAATLRGVMGHRQVADAYLVARARANGGRLVTLDQGLAALHDDVVDLIAEPAATAE
jgi:uncharacterized protein